MNYNEIVTKFHKREIDIRECIEIIQDRITELENIIATKRRHSEEIDKYGNAVPKEILKKVCEEEVAIGYKTFENLPLDVCTVYDAINHCFLEGAYTPYDEIQDLEILHNNLTNEKYMDSLSSLFEKLERQQEQEEKENTKKEILDYIQERINELEALKERVNKL